MHIEIDRLMKDIGVLSSFNKTIGEGCTRYSYTQEDKKARAYLIEEMKKIGMKVKIDSIGNIIGKLEGLNPNASAIISGSHIDTVYRGGIYDGVLGVVSALEVARVLVENKATLNRPYEVIIFTEEEGSNFDYNLIGSKALAGKFNLDKAKELKDSNGRSLYERISELDIDPDKIVDAVIKPCEIKAMIELHIEQGNILHSEGKSIGIVEGITGLKWYEVEIIGQPNHAGATPMNLRKDPMVAACEIISQISSIAEEKGSGTTVATVGSILCRPNLVNVIPEKVIFTIDIRDIDSSAVDAVADEIEHRLRNLREQQFDCRMKLISQAKDVRLSEKVLGLIEETAIEQGIEYKRMYSGANHDSSIMAEITEAAMIFVPSVDGRSHCPEEFTKQEDIEKGCKLLLDTVYKLTAR